MSDEVINYSELAALASCEAKWVYAYRMQEEEQGEKRGLHLGTLIHVWGDHWLQGEGAILPSAWTDDINTGGKPGEMRTRRLADFAPDLVARAGWLASRFESHYGQRPPSSWNVISSEEWLSTTITVDGQTYMLVGRTDGLIEIEGMLWLREMKSYGSKSRLDTVGVEPQPTIYKRLVEDTYDRELFGVLFDGVYTYEWALKKPTQDTLIAEKSAINPGFAAQTKKAQRDWARDAVARHPGVQEREPHESFRREWVDRTAEQVAQTEVMLGAAIRRRGQLQTLEDAIPNVGMACRSCGFKPRCWARLAGDDESEIEVADDGDELDWGDE